MIFLASSAATLICLSCPSNELASFSANPAKVVRTLPNVLSKSPALISAFVIPAPSLFNAPKLPRYAAVIALVEVSKSTPRAALISIASARSLDALAALRDAKARELNAGLSFSSTMPNLWLKLLIDASVAITCASLALVVDFNVCANTRWLLASARAA